MGAPSAVVATEPLPVAEARRGDPDAWTTLFRRYRMPLYVYVFELVRDEQTSLDLVQETFINAARHLEQLREDRRFGSWLFGIAHQKCLGHWRRRGRHPDPDAPVPDDWVEPGEDPGELLVRREREAQFREAIHRLPQSQREVILLFYLEDFSLEEIASVTGATMGTVKSRLYYARKTLKTILETDENAA